jgi:hypothetical protein
MGTQFDEAPGRVKMRNASRIPQTIYALRPVDGAAHSIRKEQPELVNRLLISFLSRAK